MCLLSANLPLDAFVFSSCCEDKTELCHSDNSEEEEKSCCGEDACDCTTCNLTNVYSPSEMTPLKSFTYFTESHFSYEFQYSMDSYSSLFRPPLT